VLGLFLGGSSGGNPLRETAVQVAAVFVIAFVLLARRQEGPGPGLPATLTLAGLALLFLIQLIPLPYELWASLPGRDLPAAVLQTASIGPEPRPLTLDRDRTVAAALALLAPLAMFLATAYASSKDRLILAWAVIGCAIASFALGALQLSAGSQAGTFSLYDSSHVGQPIGFFANSNHQADLMLIALVLVGVLTPKAIGTGRRRIEVPILSYGVMAAFAIATVLTSSRMAILLLPFALLTSLVRGGSFRHASGIVVCVCLVILAAVLGFGGSHVFSTSLAGVSNIDDIRFIGWQDVLYAIGQFSWAGSGIGTFQDVFKTVESLSFVSPNIFNRAHNDYLEFILETGAFGAVLLAAYLALLAMSAFRIFRSKATGPSTELAYGSLICVLLLMAHSIVDYPLRTVMISIVFGFCWGAILAGVRDEGSAKRRKE
jgi:O-antigen ligase